MKISCIVKQFSRLTALAFVFSVFELSEKSLAATPQICHQSTLDKILCQTPEQTERPSFHIIAQQPKEELSEEQMERLRRQTFGPNSNEIFETYRLADSDTIFVHVSPRSEQLSFEATVDLEGNITVPLVGIVAVEGLSLEETAQLLIREFREYLVTPSIEVTLKQQRLAGVTITGEVVQPGFYRLDDPDLIVALSEAGGTTDIADLRNIEILRYQRNQEAVTQSVDVYSAIESGAEMSLPRLIDGDIVLIPSLDEDDIQNGDYDLALVSSSNIARPEITVRALDYTGSITQIRVPNGSSFLDAITQLGPDPSSANLNEVALVRFDASSQEAKSINIDARAALAGDITQDPPLAHNDVIVVGRTTISKLNYALGLITQPFRDILSFILFFDSFASGIDGVLGSE
jgi:polysaccharide export outer membrane protein